MSAFTLSVTRGIARLSLDVPGESVNTISKSVRLELAEHLERAAADVSIRAIILVSGKPDTFIAGADIEEFARLSSREEALRLVTDGQTLIERIASSSKPIIAAIHGTCVGGGLEAALACQYRVATDHPKTSLGLPEVQLGIIPAAGGCQRLPRLIGMRAALDIILAGKTVPAARAFRLGVVHELVHPAILESVAQVVAERLTSGWRPAPRRVSMTERLLDRNPAGQLLVSYLAGRALRARTGGHYPAPLAALQAVRRGLRHGLREGLEFEAHTFADLAVSPISRKLVQIFFATRSLKKDSVPGSSGAAPIHALGVVGAGFMGSAIAGVAVSQAGVDVRLKDADATRVARGVDGARRILRDRRDRKRITRWEYQRLTALVSGGSDWAGFRRADLVIEAVFEDLSVKHGVFKELESNTRDDCVLASNTSTIPITSIAAPARRPERIVGMHFFSPVDRMPLLEIIAGDRTAPHAVATAAAFGHRMGKTVIVVRDKPGFWINRILAPYLNEAVRVAAEGVPVRTIDSALRRFGFPVGPLALLDEVGIDVGAKASHVLQGAFGERLAPIAAMDRFLQAGMLGRKSGSGFYRYKSGKKRGVNPDALTLLRGEHRASPGAPGVETRLVFAMLNEAVLALADQVVRSPRDGDVGAIYGIGFPPFLGGPLRYLDDIGAAAAVGTLQRLESTFGPRFAPAPLLVSMAKSRGRFYPDT